MLVVDVGIVIIFSQQIKLPAPTKNTQSASDCTPRRCARRCLRLVEAVKDSH